jgi:DNA polymerase III alpha subunit
MTDHDSLTGAVRFAQACRAAGTPAGWKAAAYLAGQCGLAMVPPARQLDQEALSALQERLRACGVIE